MVKKKTEENEPSSSNEKEITEKELKELFTQTFKEYPLADKTRPNAGNDNEGFDLNDEEDEEVDLSDFPLYVQKVIKRELKDLEATSGSDQAKTRRYLDWIKELPWTKEKLPRIDMRIARAVLEQRHYGLSEVKEKVLEYLAVQILTGEDYGTVLLLVGPPGVGKTSFAKTIAEAMQRKFVKISLGGVYDEAIIHGFDRTYAGSQPGNIIRALRSCGTLNPVMLLDEIDKIGQGGKYGDVAAALLEVVDSERSDFKDQYLDIPVDLSRVFYIATANEVQSIPTVLRDRMKIIEIGGYTVDEKAAIIRQYVLPKEEQRHGLKPGFINIDEDALLQMIKEYCLEPGVRTLQHQIQSICSRIAYMVVNGKTEKSFTVSRAMLPVFLGKAPNNSPLFNDRPEVGVANALAYVSVGQGMICPVEVGVLPGDGKVQYTGNLRKIIRESCEVAISLIRTRAEKWHIDSDFYDTRDIHFHALQAGIPKEGPSMGVTIFTALFSALTNIPVRGDLAMTGEITLRGRIMPIGGLEEKLTAAYNAGITRVIIPEPNRYDLPELPKELIKHVDIVFVSDVDQLLEHSLFRDKLKQSGMKQAR